jgi:hypothetical protein
MATFPAARKHVNKRTIAMGWLFYPDKHAYNPYS